MHLGRLTPVVCVNRYGWLARVPMGRWHPAWEPHGHQGVNGWRMTCCVQVLWGGRRTRSGPLSAHDWGPMCVWMDYDSGYQLIGCNAVMVASEWQLASTATYWCVTRSGSEESLGFWLQLTLVWGVFSSKMCLQLQNEYAKHPVCYFEEVCREREIYIHKLREECEALHHSVVPLERNKDGFYWCTCVLSEPANHNEHASGQLIKCQFFPSTIYTHIHTHKYTTQRKAFMATLLNQRDHISWFPTCRTVFPSSLKAPFLSVITRNNIP